MDDCKTSDVTSQSSTKKKKRKNKRKKIAVKIFSISYLENSYFIKFIKSTNMNFNSIWWFPLMVTKSHPLKSDVYIRIGKIWIAIDRLSIIWKPDLFEGCLRGVMVKAMDYGIVVREFVLQSRYYVHFRANTLGKGMNPLILPAMG